MKIIAADIGGTKSWLCLCEINPETVTNGSLDFNYLKLHFEAIYASADFSDFSALLRHFLQDAKEDGSDELLLLDGCLPAEGSLPIDTMCLALPGVIKQRHARLTNLEWELDADEIQADFKIAKVLLVNDFQAAAMGITTLQEQDTVALNVASGSLHPQQEAITVVTGAGTGLGLAWMDNTQDPLQLFATEGGHCDFAPTNDVQIELLKFLQQQYEHVSYERILSGAGLEQLYAFFSLDNTSLSSTDKQITAKQINELAEQGNSQAMSALQLFVEIYAAYIGNLALLYKPDGGIYIAGGIGKHILPWMQKKEFINSYLNKGRMAGLAAQIPVYLVINERLGLQGAIQLILKNISNSGKRTRFSEEPETIYSLH